MPRWTPDNFWNWTEWRINATLAFQWIEIEKESYWNKISDVLWAFEKYNITFESYLKNVSDSEKEILELEIRIEEETEAGNPERVEKLKWLQKTLLTLNDW